MTAVEPYRRAAKAFSVERALAAALQEMEPYILDKNTGQLERGEDRDGDRLRQYRSEEYAFEKQRMNPLPGFGNPDLKLTGSFHDKFFLSVSKNTLLISSRDSKRDELVAKYGEQIFGLNRENLEEVDQEVADEIARRFLDSLPEL